MAEVKHIETPNGKRVEVFVTAEELTKCLKQQDPAAFEKINLNYEDYCLTFRED